MKMKMKFRLPKLQTLQKEKASTHMQGLDIQSAEDAWLLLILASSGRASVVHTQGRLTTTPVLHAITFMHNCKFAISY